MAYHLARFGVLGEVGQFASVDGTRFPRGARVVLRTGRGLELGEVLAPPESPRPPRDPAAGESTIARGGSILRGVTSQDRLLAARLEKNRLAAFAACEQRLIELNLSAALMDVEYLFDGRTLCFYFLGELTPELDAVTAELAEAYEAEAQLRRFAATLATGCGPHCGSESGEGCQSCDTGCAVSGACATRPRQRRAGD